MLNAARDALRGDSMLGREERQAAEAAVDVVGCVRLGRLAGCNTAPALQLVFSTWAAGLFGRLPRFSGTPFCTSICSLLPPLNAAGARPHDSGPPADQAWADHYCLVSSPA